MVTGSYLESTAKVTSAKIMLGTMLLFTIPFPHAEAHVQANPIHPSISYITHQVTQGDTIWTISVQYGVPMSELLQKNHLTMNSNLSIGQKLSIPVHFVPTKPVITPHHGELLNWWTEAQYVFTIGKTAKIIDFQTGKTFFVKRTIGANHADCEPLTAKDAAMMKEVWGGAYSWKLRPVLVEIDGRKIAASMASMPHGVEYITDNQFTGHFDIHFLESTRHKDGKTDMKHQHNIKISAGLQSL